jgi:NADH-quinone oxidoreductase subunit J
MHVILYLLFFVTLVSAVAAMTLRNLVHCALCLTITFAGLAAVYLQMNAQFIGFVQLLVYVGAVGILVIFAILLTRGVDSTGTERFSRTWIPSLGVSILVLGTLAISIRWGGIATTAKAAPVVTVKGIGTQLMTQYVLPLEIMGLLLTAALIGAVILGMEEKKASGEGDHHG